MTLYQRPQSLAAESVAARDRLTFTMMVGIPLIHGLSLFLRSILMSGLMFPFRGMPDWARMMMLKGSGFPQVWPDLWPMVVFLLAVSVLAVKRHRQTLD